MNKKWAKRSRREKKKQTKNYTTTYALESLSFFHVYAMKIGGWFFPVTFWFFSIWMSTKSYEMNKNKKTTEEQTRNFIHLNKLIICCGLHRFIGFSRYFFFFLILAIYVLLVCDLVFFLADFVVMNPEKLVLET